MRNTDRDRESKLLRGLIVSDLWASGYRERGAEQVRERERERRSSWWFWNLEGLTATVVSLNSRWYFSLNEMGLWATFWHRRCRLLLCLGSPRPRLLRVQTPNFLGVVWDLAQTQGWSSSLTFTTQAQPNP